ncbi:MAG: hypothetical protein EHM33_18680 [Chloroflexi bacterium]|nr:MAG: hypothetical protein EHM33_18680 [Chloroflexota bacterium]
MRENNERWFIQMTALLAVLAALLAVGNVVIGFAAVGFTAPPDTFSNVSSSLPIDGIDAGLLRWSTICDLFGFYLFLGPLVLVLSRGFEQTRPYLIQLATYCALGYILVGAIAAVILASTAPPLIESYAQASDVDRVSIKIAYDSVNNIVNGLWNTLGVFLGGVWWLTIGNAIRAQRPVLGILSIVLGIAAWLDAAGTILVIPAIFAIGLGGVLLLIPIWTLSCGISLLRHPEI